MKRLLITGAAGFIGASLSKQILLMEGDTKVVGIDNLNDYYDKELKKSRLEQLEQFENFSFVKGDIVDKTLIQELFEEYQPEIVINFAAQGGVRHSIDKPDDYINSNIIGFYNILEGCRYSYNIRNHKEKEGYKGVSHLIYASSSSVYGMNTKVPYSINDKADSPASLYAATKKSNELMAYAYSKLYGIPATGLRFFTVYGPAGRPDMAYFKFTEKMVKGEKIQIYNHGNMERDFTYIDDIISGVMKVVMLPPKRNDQGVCHKLYNIGNSKPENLLYFVEVLEGCLMKEGIINKPAEKEFLPMQPGDVYATYADVKALVEDFGFKPSTSIETGLSRFVEWYKEYYNKI